MNDNTETMWKVAELICLDCLSRWIGVYPADVNLKDIECKCGKTGHVIKTGQSLPDTEVINARGNKNDRLN